MSNESKRTVDETISLLKSYQDVVGFQSDLIDALRRNREGDEAEKDSIYDTAYEEGYEAGWNFACEQMRVTVFNAVRRAVEADGWSVSVGFGKLTMEAIKTVAAPGSNDEKLEFNDAGIYQ